MSIEGAAERKHRLPVSVSAAVFIEDEQGRLLLLQQDSEAKGNKWGPPAGGMKPHEDPAQTARRETKEEIGVEVELTGLIGIYTADRGDARSSLAFVFRGRVVSGKIILAEGEIKDWGYFDREGIEKIISQGLLYKPEYNLVGIEDWRRGNNFELAAMKGLILRD